MPRRGPRSVVVTLLGLLLSAGIASVVLAPSATATHDAVDWSRFVTAVGFDSRNQLYPTVFTDHDGGLYLFQYDRAPTGQTNLTVAKFTTRSATGNPLLVFPPRNVNWEPGRLNTVRTTNDYGFAWAPAVAMDGDGALYVAWTDTSLNVWVARSADGGETWDPAVRVQTTAGPTINHAPDLVAMPNGDVVILWTQRWSASGISSIGISRTTDGGATWSPRTNVTSGIEYWTNNVAAQSDGRLHVVWTAAGPGTLRTNYSRSEDGSEWSAPILLDGGTVALFPSVVVDAADRVHVLWYDFRSAPSGNPTYWYRRSADGGATWSLELPVSQGRFPTGAASLPQLSVFGDTVIASWYAISGVLTFAYAISTDGGDLWYPEDIALVGQEAFNVQIAADENGTFYAAYDFFNELWGSQDIGFSIWDGPPSPPTITGIGRDAGQLTVSWTGSPEGDVAGYRLWRSSDGFNFGLVATLDSSARTYVDSGLANGTYWYRVTAFDHRATSSHASNVRSASVGLSLEEMIAELEAELAALEDQNSAEAEQLRQRIDELEQQLNAIQADKATQAQSILNTILLLFVIGLLLFMFLRSRRQGMAPIMMAPTAPAVPPPSQWPAPEPTRPEPPKPEPSRFPEEEL